MKAVDHRVAMFAITPQMLIDLALNNSDFYDQYPGAQRIAINYEFDSDTFRIKFRHESLPEIKEGNIIPTIDPPRFVDTPKPWWRMWRCV